MSENLADRIEALDAKAEQAVIMCPRCEGEGGYPDGVDEAACHTECTRCGGNGWIVDLAALRLAEMPLPDVAGLVERFGQYLGVYGVLTNDDRAFFGEVLTTLTAQAQRIAELEAENARLQVGSLTLYPGYNPGTLFIQQSSGEGGEFHVSDVETALQAFYAENF